MTKLILKTTKTHLEITLKEANMAELLKSYLKSVAKGYNFNNYGNPSW